jgi:hypothetical protein
MAKQRLPGRLVSVYIFSLLFYFMFNLVKIILKYECLIWLELLKLY